MRPEEIERASFAIIDRECAERGIIVPEALHPIVYRAIHATADFDYAETMAFSEGAVEAALAAIRDGADVTTDTNMALMGVSGGLLERFGGRVCCYMARDEVARTARERGVTRAYVSMEYAKNNQDLSGKPMIFAVGNAPTALLSLCGLMDHGFKPALVIGVPVGFVQVVEAKELLMQTCGACGVPWIVNRGRKGGSGVAAAIVNALLRLALEG